MDQTHISYTGRQIIYQWATWEAHSIFMHINKATLY